MTDLVVQRPGDHHARPATRRGHPVIRRILLAVSAAAAAGTAAILALAAVQDARWGSDPGAPVALALGAVWVSQALYLLARRPAPPKERA